MSLPRELVQLFLRLLPLRWRDRLLANLVEKSSPEALLRLGFPTMEGFLRHLGRVGFRPRNVLDIGVFVGDWSRLAAPIFPDAQFFLFEANPRNEEQLRQSTKEIGERAKIFLQLLGPQAQPSVPFFQIASGSSVLEELTPTERELVHLPMVTLDDCLPEPFPDFPLLTKLDVQGYELEVLRGGTRALERSEVVILEVALLPYNNKSPLLAEVIAVMAQAGFVAYDFCGQFRRQSDHTLFQTDVAFVKENSILRWPNLFWLHACSNEKQLR